MVDQTAEKSLALDMSASEKAPASLLIEEEVTHQRAIVEVTHQRATEEAMPTTQKEDCGKSSTCWVHSSSAKPNEADATVRAGGNQSTRGKMKQMVDLWERQAPTSSHFVPHPHMKQRHGCANARDKVEIKVNGISGILCTVSANRSWLVRDVKKAIENQVGIPTTQQKLVHGSHTLADCSRLRFTALGQTLEVTLVRMPENEFHKLIKAREGTSTPAPCGAPFRRFPTLEQRKQQLAKQR